MNLFHHLLALTALAAAGCSPAAVSEVEEAAAGTAKPVVSTGLEVLVTEDFTRLRGLRLGVVANHTGTDREGRSIIDLLLERRDIRLEAVFTPEHGLTGKLEGAYGSSRLEGGALKVYSLYGETRKPLPQWLSGLDALVFDIQDIGTRFYTYGTTMALCMQAAAEAGISFFVLDRPNPIGGLVVEGPVLEKALQGDFIAYYPVPVRHGMTMGELARLYNREFGIGTRLEVVEMRGYTRSMYYDDTSLPWIDPSPNMRSLTAALLYPGCGIAEAANLSVGRGTELPFELYGAPYVDGRRLAAELNQAGVEGVAFKDTSFVPASYKFQGELCGGVRAIVSDRGAFRSLEAGMHLLSALKKLYPGDFDLTNIDRWIGRRDVKERIARGEPVERIMESWREDLEKFLEVREKYLLYRP
ncbi:MAG: DUF1343 domain-containing protein [Candidatus Glassbacteria bacterium]|nr:DUF1343 domain-containing protein [Candidatus Glassbacteria bacterium]